MHVTQLFHYMNSTHLIGTRCLALCFAMHRFHRAAKIIPTKGANNVPYDVRLLMSAESLDGNLPYSADSYSVEIYSKTSLQS